MSCAELVAVPDPQRPGKRSCLNCGRPVATYGGREQHRRGGAAGTRMLSSVEVVRMLPERIEALEAAATAQFAAIDALATSVHGLTRAVDRFLDRQPLVLEVRPQHRREVDGGEGARGEMRRTRRALKKVAGE